MTEMRWAYVGNFKAPYSTENDVARALVNNGHHVERIPEQSLDWTEVPRLAEGCDVFLWTRTAGFDPPDLTTQEWALKHVGIPTVGYHLDRWWGLDREADVMRSPFFRVDLLCTAHGSDEWAKHGIRHRWFPPAVSSSWLEPGRLRPSFVTEIAFVGNLYGYGHTEWAAHREAMGARLVAEFGEAFTVIPDRRHRDRQLRSTVRGQMLTDFYASGRVFVGDSCLAGNPVRYWSDRIPETLGRGGFLIHPDVVGLKQQHPDLTTYPLGDFDALVELIGYYLEHDELRKGIAEENKRHVANHHTYEHRMRRLVETLETEGLI